MRMTCPEESQQSFTVGRLINIMPFEKGELSRQGGLLVIFSTQLLANVVFACFLRIENVIFTLFQIFS